MAFNGGNNFANQPFTNSSKGNGYLPFGEALHNSRIGGALDTTNPSSDPNPGADKWTEWFGTPPYTSYQRDNYADLGHENYQLPTAYIGRNLHIEKLLNVSIASQDDFYTRVLLPWRVFDGMKITFSKWSGFDHLMAQVPEEVPAPQIQTRFEQGEAYQQRYGLAFKMEHGFQRTEMGRQAYAMNLAIITQAVLRTVYARVMQVLVGNRNWLSVLAAKNYPSAAVQAREISKASVNSFGCIQKNTHGLDLLMNNILRLFHDRMLSAPDAVVIPHGVLAYISACKPESRVYALCGALAERLGIKSERELITNVYGDNYSVFEHRPMNVANDTANEVNMLARDREVGNFWKIFRKSYGSPYSTPSAPDGQPSAIRIIDHDKQRWVTITLTDALSHSEAFNADGSLNRRGPLANFLNGNNAGQQKMPVHISGAADYARQDKDRLGSGSGEAKFANLGRDNLRPKTLDMAVRSMNAAARRLGDIRDRDGGEGIPRAFEKRIENMIKNASRGAAAPTPAGSSSSNGSRSSAGYVSTFTGGDEDSYTPGRAIQDAVQTLMKSRQELGDDVTMQPGDFEEKIEAGENFNVLMSSPRGTHTIKFENRGEGEYDISKTKTKRVSFADERGGSLIMEGIKKGAEAIVKAPMKALEAAQEVVESITDSAEAATEVFFDAVETPLEATSPLLSEGAPEFNATIGAFVGDISKGDAVSFASYLRGIADVGANTKKFSKTIKKVKAIGATDPKNAGAFQEAQEAASQEFLKDAKKAWKDIQKSAKLFRSAVASKKGAPSFRSEATPVADDTDYLAVWDSSSATIGGARDRQGQYGRTGNRFAAGAPANSAAAFYLGLPLTLQTIEVLDSLGIVTPFGAIVFRPFQSFNMGSAVVLKAGNDTGFTCVGNSDFQLGDSVTNKTHLGHFTFYFEPVVHEPNHVMIARDVAFMGYNGGAGARWFNEWKDAGTNVLVNGGVRPSLLCAIAFSHEGDDNIAMDPMSISGFFAEGSILCNLEDAFDTGTGSIPIAHYDMARWYDEQLEKGLGTNNLDDDTSSATDGAFHGTGTNFVCYQGLQCEVDTDGRWSKWTTNTGHLGDAETTDSSLAWSGHLAFKTSVNYHVNSNTVSLSAKTT